MSLLLPLGLLGLLGIGILILIYILKPNYQQKIVSSTHVWRLSLKYRRKKIPINKFRNILIFICQLLIITACAFILARPVIPTEVEEARIEKIAIIDASASMRTAHEGESRFERAVNAVALLAEETFAQQGNISVILAGLNAEFVAQRTPASGSEEFETELFDLLEDPQAQKDSACSYGEGDIAGAMSLAETVLNENPNAEVLFYTGTKYIDDGGVTVVDVSEEGEWNAAILDCTAKEDDNFVVFEVEIASYGMDRDITVVCDVVGVNADNTGVGNNITLSQTVRCEGDAVQKITLDGRIHSAEGMGVYSYQTANVHIEVNDDFSRDNTFWLYGGGKQPLRIQYTSSKRNTFFNGALVVLRDVLAVRWDLDYSEVNLDKGENPEMEGFDLYIFEHTMPSELPKDGVSLLVNPDRAPEGTDIVLTGERITGDFTLAPGETHPIMNHVNADTITVSEYVRIQTYDNYTPLVYCGGDPVLLARNLEESKVVMLAFSLNMTNFPALIVDFSLWLYNIINFYMPSTLEKTVFNVNEAVSLNARGPELTLNGEGEPERKYAEFPASFKPVRPGSYTLTQELMGTVTSPSGDVSPKIVVEDFFVRIPRIESNIAREEDELSAPVLEERIVPVDYDLLLYFAAALVALLFAEWWLQSKEYF